ASRTVASISTTSNRRPASRTRKSPTVERKMSILPWPRRRKLFPIGRRNRPPNDRRSFCASPISSSAIWKNSRAPNQSILANRSRSREFFQIRSEEHTSELQSRENRVCRLVREKKNKHDAH